MPKETGFYSPSVLVSSAAAIINQDIDSILKKIDSMLKFDCSLMWQTLNAEIELQECMMMEMSVISQYYS